MDERLLDRLCKIAADRRRRTGMVTEHELRVVADEYDIDLGVLVEHARGRGWLR